MLLWFDDIWGYVGAACHCPLLLLQCNVRKIWKKYQAVVALVLIPVL